jgi:hypothetical protein
MEGGIMLETIALLLNIPICIRLVCALVFRLEVDPSGTRFAGHYRNWEVRTLTGRVVGANAYTTTSTRTTYTESQYHGGYDKRVSVSSSLHNTLLLVDATGQQHSLTVTDFGLEVWADQIVTVCWAVKGRKSILFAVLNHSTRREFTQTWHCIDRVAIPRVWLATTEMIVSVITLIGIIPAFAWAGAVNLQLRHYKKKGTAPLWTSTAPAAAALTAPSPYMGGGQPF